jgi:ABC-type lipoprotein release transport system permease subunit
MRGARGPVVSPLSTATLVRRSLVHYRRTNAAVVGGVAVAVAVLAGALLVGRSVRASLRALAEQRIGRTDAAVVGERPFEASLAARLASPGSATAPLLSLRAVVSEPSSGRRASPVEVWGVDERFWAFHGLEAPALAGRQALASPALAEELAASAGASLLVRAETAQEISGSTLFGRRDEPGRALRLTLAGVRSARELGEFSLRPRQDGTRALFVPHDTLQDAFGREGRVNVVLARGAGAAALGEALARVVSLPDLGLRLRELEPGRSYALESEDALLDDAVVGAARAAAAEAGLRASASLVYLANELRVGDAAVPYSLVAAVDDGMWRALGGEPLQNGAAEPPVLLNEWTARELGARAGDALRLEYDLWHEEGRLETRHAAFRVAGVVPIAGAAADRGLVPDYPGITQSERLADWDPPFAVDLSRVRPRDEEYWRRYRTTPKAWLPLAAGQALWAHRLGRTTSLRLTRDEPGAPAAASSGPAGPSAPASAFGRSLVARLSPAARGLAVDDVRARALDAARGATDFGEYFVYFSFFLVVAALLLAGLFFRFGLEQRLAELGLLRAVGFSAGRLRGLFLAEAVVLGGLGALLGAVLAIGYAGLMMLGLRTVWVDAVGTRALALAVGPLELALGVTGAFAAAVASILVTLRGLGGRSPRSLLARAPAEWRPSPGARRARAALALAAAAALLVGAGVLGRVPTVAAFFGAGALVLGACLAWISAALAGERRSAAAATATVPALGFRQAAFRPGRSVLAMALVAFAAFVIVAVGAFRHGGPPDTGPQSETGGFALLARSVLPLHHDPGTPAGRAALGWDGVPELAALRIARFRLKPGEDASCLNLYRPQRPTVVAPTAAFLRERRFAFQASLAATTEEKANPWLLLERDAPDGAVPVIADAGALAYVLHRRLGETFVIGGDAGQGGVRVRVVGALRPGLLQSELVTGERHFQAAFPEADGYRFFLVEADLGRASAVAQALESRLADFGLDAESAASRLAAFHRVENTYIATFQTLGALGLLLGTLGIGAVLVRNAFEQRRELALLRAVGYRARHVRTLVLAESALLLLLGLAIGVGAALVATLPALVERQALPSLVPVLLLLAVVAVVGLAVARLAASAVLRLPVLESLRAE